MIQPNPKRGTDSRWNEPEFLCSGMLRRSFCLASIADVGILHPAIEQAGQTRLGRGIPCAVLLSAIACAERMQGVSE